MELSVTALFVSWVASVGVPILRPRRPTADFGPGSPLHLAKRLPYSLTHGPEYHRRDH